MFCNTVAQGVSQWLQIAKSTDARVVGDARDGQNC